MKKTVVLILGLAAFSTCLCFAKKDREEGVAIPPSASVYGGETSNTEDYSEYEIENEYEEEERERQERREAKAEEKAEKKNEKDLKRKGWQVGGNSENKTATTTFVKKNGKNKDVVQGIGKIQTFSKNGSVGIYIASLKKSWYPIIETTDLAESTYVSLFIDGVEYRLNRSRRVDYFFEVDDNSVTIVYTIEKIAELRVTYKFAEPKNPDGGIEDAWILVSYSLTNIDRMEHSFALKAVFNTVLGESNRAHFSISEFEDVNSETVLVPSPQNKFIVSKDEKRKAKFVIYNPEYVLAKKVVLANKDVVENAGLETVLRHGRSFSSVLSYNNSGILLFWDEKSLFENDGKTFFRIELSNSEYGDTSREEDPIPEPAPEPPVEETLADETPQPAEEPKENLNYNFYTERNYLDPSIDERYVRKLIDQINALERSDPDVNRAKIRELQAEIDEVLRVLRSRR